MHDEALSVFLRRQRKELPRRFKKALPRRFRKTEHCVKYLGLILRNLGRSKRRTVLTILSIGVSLFVFALLLSVPAIANRAIADTASSVRLICINKAGMTYGLPAAYRPKIAALPHVQAVIAQSWFGGIYHEVSDQFSEPCYR
jgi:putative ABC transport system permease protein